MVIEKPNQDLEIDRQVNQNALTSRHHHLRFVKLSGYFAVALLTTLCLLNCRTAREKLGSSTTSVSANVRSDGVALTNVPLNMTKATDRWHVYTAPDKSFSVEVPCNLVDQYHNDSYSCDVEDDSSLNFFLVEVLIMSDAARAKMRDEHEFERNIKRELPPNRHVTKMVPIKVEDGVGREILVTNSSDSDDNSRARIIIVGRRYYVVAFNSGDPKALESPRAERFLSTFKAVQ